MRLAPYGNKNVLQQILGDLAPVDHAHEHGKQPRRYQAIKAFQRRLVARRHALKQEIEADRFRHARPRGGRWLFRDFRYSDHQQSPYPGQIYPGQGNKDSMPGIGFRQAAGLHRPPTQPASHAKPA